MILHICSETEIRPTKQRCWELLSSSGWSWMGDKFTWAKIALVVQGVWDVWCEPLTIIKLIKPERPKGLLHLARIPMCIVFDDFQILSVTFVVCWWGNDQGNSIGVVNPQRIWTPVIQSWRKHCRFHFDSLCTNVLKAKRSSNLSWRGEHPAT